MPNGLRTEIEEAHLAGVTYNTISDWLAQEHGIVGKTRHMISRHFTDKHVLGARS